MKKINVLMVVLSLMLALCGVQINSSVLNVHAAEVHPSRVVDEADILTDDEEMQLLSQVDEISERQQFDVVIVTVESLDGEDIQNYAADYYDYNGYGMGDNYDGAMFIISMEEREWFILTTGAAIDVLTDSEMDSMGEEIVPYLSSGEYAYGFSLFAEYCDKQVLHEDEQDTTPGTYDELIEDEEVYYEDAVAEEEAAPPGIAVSIIIGIVLAFIPVLIMSSQLKNVHMQSSAGGYEKRGSRKINVQKDIFLYHTVNRVPKPKENNSRSGSSSSGGSSTFRGSSGRSHGGRGGGF